MKWIFFFFYRNKQIIEFSFVCPFVLSQCVSACSLKKFKTATSKQKMQSKKKTSQDLTLLFFPPIFFLTHSSKTDYPCESVWLCSRGEAELTGLFPSLPRCRTEGHNDGIGRQQQHLRRGEAAGLHRRTGGGLLDRPHGLQCLGVLEEKKEEGTQQLCRWGKGKKIK